MPQTFDFDLAERVSVTGDNALVPFLRDNPDLPLRLSARRLRRMDTPLVQLLLAVAADRRRRGVPFALCDLSPAQADLLASLGITDAVLPMERAQ
jgi:anti-anti-sigma regulatory factor